MITTGKNEKGTITKLNKQTKKTKKKPTNIDGRNPI